MPICTVRDNCSSSWSTFSFWERGLVGSGRCGKMEGATASGRASSPRCWQWQLPDQLSLSPWQCPLYLCPPLEALEEGGPPLALGLEGEHQRSNAALALQLARCWLQQKNHQGKWADGWGRGMWSLPWKVPCTLRPHRSLLPPSSGLGELKVSRPSVLWQMPLAPVFQPTSHMRHGELDLLPSQAPSHVACPF